MGAWRRTDFPFTLRAAKRSEGTSGEAGLYVGEKGRSSRTGPEKGRDLLWVSHRGRQNRPSARLDLLHEFLGNEHVSEYAGNGDHQNHLQHDANAGDIATDSTDSTTQKRLHEFIRVI